MNLNKKEFIRLIKSKKLVFANVKLTPNDCWYVQVVKANLLLTIAGHSPETQYDVVVRDDAIYID